MFLCHSLSSLSLEKHIDFSGQSISAEIDKKKIVEFFPHFWDYTSNIG